MEAWVMIQLEYLLRVLIAAVCGGAIGHERSRRSKMAGIRTHLIVCMAAALMMIISKYGFQDILGTAGVGLDPSRIAASVVAAIGFLGAGVIFVRNQNVSGVTTAAGLWATVGVGMAVGCGMYFMGVLVTVTIVLLQVILHTKFFKEGITQQISLHIDADQNVEQLLEEAFGANQIEILYMSAKNLSDGAVEVRLSVKYPKNYDVVDLVALMRQFPFIRYVED